MRVITQILGADKYSQGIMISSAIFFTFIFVYKIFVWMGIWRAANRYKENEVWANLAKAMVVFSILITMWVADLIYDAIGTKAFFLSFLIIISFYIYYAYRIPKSNSYDNKDYEK
jgi:FlaA1/EpsC-like NDP-sugar epimerase